MRKENSDADIGLKFKENFHELYDMSKCQSITQFAQKLQMNRQSVDRYYNGERLPDLTSIIQICRIMNVSADWLLGLSEIRSSNQELKAACKFTGLSEPAIEKITQCEGRRSLMAAILSKLIEAEGFAGLMLAYKNFLDSASKLKESSLDEPPHPQRTDGEDYVILNRNEATHHFMTRASLAMNHICEEEYYKQLDEAMKNAARENPNEIQKNVKLYHDLLNEEET